MDLYNRTAYALAQLLTRRYSSSFGNASRLFPKALGQHIYAIYGLVRVADEIVDSYQGSDKEKLQLLDDLEQETYAAIRRGFSVNPIIQAFATSAEQYGIGQDLLQPFFASMRSDVDFRAMDQTAYETYIYGSAEVVGLMCLRVFCGGDQTVYDKLAPGAQRLGAAYQKVNFLRDLRADHQELGRCYFPGYTYQTFDAAAKAAVVADIRHDFTAALPYIRQLPPAARPAVTTSYEYYNQLLARLDQAPVEYIKAGRLSLPAYRKAILLARNVRLRP
jgi:phytoene synthase